MDSPLRRALEAHRSLSVMGMCKNAGKTTVLGRLLTLLAEEGRLPGLTSIGRDGEREDLVTGTPKPGVYVRAGSLVATAADMLRLCDATREILLTTGVSTPLGEVVVFRALTDGFVHLAGPSMARQLPSLAATLQDLGADVVLIDGAVSRKSLGAPTVSDAAILCAGASYHPDMETVVADTAHACALLTLPAAGREPPGRRHAPQGAVTDAVAQALSLQPGDEIVVRDSSRLLLSRSLFERLRARGVRFSVATPTKLCCVCVNPYSATGPGFSARAFREAMARAVPVPVLDVKEPCHDRP